MGWRKWGQVTRGITGSLAPRISQRPGGSLTGEPVDDVHMTTCEKTATHLVLTTGSPRDVLMCAACARSTGRRMIPLAPGSPRPVCGSRVEQIRGQ